MPNVKALHERLGPQGFEVVGVSLDEDQEALAAYLEENAIAWETLAGEGTQDLAEKYSVRGIPTMMLVDREGKIVAVAHNVAALTPLAEKLLGGE
jgi:thioredoxin-related protein